jgi:ADP-dependent NAD(P)H-hydrate dehydratase / NAD(P)H-hydrate epimerase
MRLPTPLSRRNKNVHKNTFGHVLILAGSRRMLGAAALASLSAMRSGSGLVTVGIPESLNKTMQQKVSHVVMTLPLPETPEGSISESAFKTVQEYFKKAQVVALGCGMTTHPSTIKLIHKTILKSPLPLVIDADALNALVGNLNILKETKTAKILTPHPGELARLLGMKKESVEANRKKICIELAAKLNCVILLKGPQTIVASSSHIYINKTGNAGMATAGSGDVLTGMIASFLGQGLSAFQAAKYGAYYHGKAGDVAARRIGSRISLIATDLIDAIPHVLN